MLKKLLKTPALMWTRNIYRCLKPVKVDTDFTNLSNEDIFDTIYIRGTWGKNPAGVSISGSGSHSPEIIQPYVKVLREYLTSNLLNPIRIVDLGCGDFNVGSKLCDLAADYVACDVSRIVLNRVSVDYPSVTTLHLDITKDKLPPGDVAILRQVAQHLSNKDILNFVSNLETQNPYRHLIVTEHIPERFFTPNLNKPSGPNIRMSINSGIDLAKTPFKLKHISSKILCEVPEANAGRSGIIRTTAYILK